MGKKATAKVLTLSSQEVNALYDLVTYLWDDESQDCEEWGDPVGHIFHSVRTCNKALDRIGRATYDEGGENG